MDLSDLFIFLRGLGVGLFLCAPFGPVGVIALQNALAQSRSAGAAAILGGSVVDLIYCALAGVSITFLSQYLEAEHIWIQASAGLVVVFMGLSMYMAPPPEKQRHHHMHLPRTVSRPGAWWAFWTSFFVMAINPLPILFFTVLFSALGVHGWRGDYAATAVLVAGVGVGSALWAPIVMLMAGLFRKEFSEERKDQIKRYSGLVLAFVGFLLGIASLFE
ncbi:MAG: LysE family transporter [Thermodesulfobacteriota bacterium]